MKKRISQIRFLLMVFVLALLLSGGTWSVYAASTQTGKAASASIKKGLVRENGGYRYYSNNKPVRNTWRKVNGKYYWFCASGMAARNGSCNVKGVNYIFDSQGRKVTPARTSVVQINGMKFIVNKYGKGLSGWQEVNGRFYYAYKSGRCIVNKTVGGIKLGGNGYAADSTQVRCKMAANRFIANHTTADMSNRQKLRACFNYIVAYNRFVGSMDPTPSEFKSGKWVYKYALQMFENGLTGNCYGIASSVAAVAKELGYQPYVITLAEGHSFVMINGRYYDNMYGALFDAASRPSYVIQYKIKF